MVGFTLGASSQAALPSAAEVVSRLDKDADGTLSWSEVQDAAIAEFKKLDTNSDGTVDAKEWRAGGFTASQWKATGQDAHGKLTQTNYLAWAKKQFAAADPDRDGTVSSQELAAPGAKGLLRILQ